MNKQFGVEIGTTGVFLKKGAIMSFFQAVLITVAFTIVASGLVTLILYIYGARYKCPKCKKHFLFFDSFHYHMSQPCKKDMAEDNPFCEHCKETDCCISLDGTCAMIRVYLNGQQNETK